VHSSKSIDPGKLTLYGAKILDLSKTAPGACSPATWSFWRFVTGPLAAFGVNFGPGIVRTSEIASAR